MTIPKVYVYSFEEIGKYVTLDKEIICIIPAGHALALGAPMIGAMQKNLFCAPHVHLWIESENPCFTTQLERHSLKNIKQVSGLV